jgi:hypothetical protein
MEDIDKKITGIKSKIDTYKGWVLEEKEKLEAYEALKAKRAIQHERVTECLTDTD